MGHVTEASGTPRTIEQELTIAVDALTTAEGALARVIGAMSANPLNRVLAQAAAHHLRGIRTDVMLLRSAQERVGGGA